MSYSPPPSFHITLTRHVGASPIRDDLKNGVSTALPCSTNLSLVLPPQHTCLPRKPLRNRGRPLHSPPSTTWAAPVLPRAQRGRGRGHHRQSVGWRFPVLWATQPAWRIPPGGPALKWPILSMSCASWQKPRVLVRGGAAL